MNTEIRQEIIETLKINIDLFIDKLKELKDSGKFKEIDENIIGLFLLGHTREYIAERENKSYQTIGDRLSKTIYLKIAQLMEVKKEEIAGNWVKILHFLLDPHNTYGLNPPLKINYDNFQSSFGNQFFIFSGNQKIITDKISATEAYQEGNFYQAYQCFLSAWQTEKEVNNIGNPETLIYLNNCLIEEYKNELKERNVKVYTLAVVVPFHHNQGKIATEILRGIAQIQSRINYRSYQHLPNLQYIEELQDQFSTIHENAQEIVIKILVVNEPNNIHFPTNQTAEKLCELSSQLNIIAVLGHYSSEMTKKALLIYKKHGLALLNFSSTSNELSNLSTAEKLNFYRLTTQDSITTENLVNYLTTIYQDKQTQNTSIIYNKNSSYSRSYQTNLSNCLEKNIHLFNLLEDYPNLGGEYHEIRSYLTQLTNNHVNIIFLIPDGGIEPNSLNNIGLISRLNINHCLIAGSATFYQENVINWIDELDQLELVDHKTINIIACIPWHFNSYNNGANSDNYIPYNFCKLGRQLWGENHLTWRSATAFDALLTVFRTLEKNTIDHHRDLSKKMDIFLKRNPNVINGVTGKIQFLANGDRLNPPTEIVKVKFNESTKKWEWDIA